MLKLQYGEHSIDANNDWADVRPLVAECLGVAEKSVDYLLQYGFSQSLQDSKAQPQAAAKKSGDDADAAASAAMAKRFDAIVAGTVSERVGGSRSQFETTLRDVIDEFLAKWSRKTGNKLPTKQAELEPLRVKMYASKNKSKIDAEVARRRESDVDVDM